MRQSDGSFILTSDCTGCMSKQEVCVHYPVNEVCKPGSGFKNDKSYCVEHDGRALKCMSSKSIVLSHKHEVHYIFKPLHLHAKEKSVSIYGEGKISAHIEPHFLTNSPHVTHLYVKDVLIKNKPTNMLSQSLTSLALENCGLNDLPANLFEYPNLRSMTISSNNLKNLGGLPPFLQHLDARDNHINHLPFGLAGLERLFLDGNQVRRAGGNWPRLTNLGLSDNPMDAHDGFDANVPVLSIFDIDDHMKTHPKVKEIFDRIEKRGRALPPPAAHKKQTFDVIFVDDPMTILESAHGLKTENSQRVDQTKYRQYMPHFAFIFTMLVAAIIFTIYGWRQSTRRPRTYERAHEPASQSEPEVAVDVDTAAVKPEEKKDKTKPDKPRGDARIAAATENTTEA